MHSPRIYVRSLIGYLRCDCGPPQYRAREFITVFERFNRILLAEQGLLIPGRLNSVRQFSGEKVFATECHTSNGKAIGKFRTLYEILRRLQRQRGYAEPHGKPCIFYMHDLSEDPDFLDY